MRSLTLTVALITILVASGCTGPGRNEVVVADDGESVELSAPQTFADADSLKDWSFSNGPEWPGARGALEWRSEGGREDSGAAALDYNFEQGGNYVAAKLRLPGVRPVKAVRMWMRKPAANLLFFRGVDADGEAFQKSLRYDYPDWQQLEIALGGWEHSWGGDGTFREPATQFHIVLANDGGDRAGRLLVDDLQWVYAPGSASASASARAIYTESDFTDADRWSYQGDGAGGFSAGEWRYRFTPEQRNPHLVRDRSILGKPRRMLLTVESDGSGHELMVRCGSHFQYFDRTLGTLDAKGPMTFEVPMGDMKSWKHFGGENDGIVRYPLRLFLIALTQKGEADEGVIRLKKLQFDTEYSRDRETVAMIPTVAATDDGAARFTVELRSLAEKPLRGQLHWELHSADRRLRAGQRRLTLPALGKSVFAEIDGEWAENSVLEGRFQFRASGVESDEVSTTIARAARDSADPTLDPASRIGVGMYLYRFHGQPDTKAWMERMCDLAARAGVKWTREEFQWSWIEPQPGQYDFSFFDQLVETAHANGISVYALCAYWAPWTQPFTDEGIEDYCNYLEVLVRRYRDRIKHWEIWNEPNIFFWSGPKEMYTKLLRRSYETIKAIDPDAQVLGCSTAGIDTAFIKNVIDGGGSFDALTVHPYRGALDPHGFINELRATRELAGGRDVWITEMGWPSNIGGLTERQQAQYVARTYISALASGAARSVAWYDFREDGIDPFYNEHHFGLVRTDLVPKIGYRALATVGRLLGSTEFERELELGQGLIGFEFRDDQRRVAALWSLDGAKLIRIVAGGRNVRFLNMVGDAAHVTAFKSATLLALEDDTPVYVVSDAELELETLDPPARLTLDRPGVHPGETVLVRVEREDGVAVDLTAPAGWRIRSNDARHAFEVTPPPQARHGDHTLQATIWVGNTEFAVPIKVSVLPGLLRG